VSDPKEFPDTPPAHALTVRSYIGEERYQAVCAAVHKPKRRRRRAAVAKKETT